MFVCRDRGDLRVRKALRSGGSMVFLKSTLLLTITISPVSHLASLHGPCGTSGQLLI